MLDVVIIGSGPAGLTSAIYAKRAELSVVVIEKEYLGTGQIAESSLVDNYPGIPETDGYSLGEAFREHAERLGTEFIEAEVTSIEKKDNIFICKCDNGDTIEAESVIFATGCHHRNLGIEDEAKYTGKGISYCAVCDGAFYKDKTATVIGGGDTALDDALYLSDICSRVNLIHRRDEFRGSKLTLERLKSKENVNIITKANVKNITGEYPNLIRPPYGSYNSDVKKIANMPIILWNIDTLDWKYKDKDRIAKTIIENAKDGSVILLHDLYQSSVEGALLAMQELYNDGYAFVTIDEMCILKGITLENSVYRNFK